MTLLDDWLDKVELECVLEYIKEVKGKSLPSIEVHCLRAGVRKTLLERGYFVTKRQDINYTSSDIYYIVAWNS